MIPLSASVSSPRLSSLSRTPVFWCVSLVSGESVLTGLDIGFALSNVQAKLTKMIFTLKRNILQRIKITLLKSGHLLALIIISKNLSSLNDFQIKSLCAK